MTFLELLPQAFSLAAAEEQSLEALWRYRWLILSAQVELMEISDKLALVFWIFVKVLDEADYLLIKRGELHLRPLLLFRGRDLLCEIEQWLAWEKVYVIRLAPVSI